MFFPSAILLVVAFVFSPAFGDDDDFGLQAGVTYFIQNPLTGLVFHTQPGNLIVGMPIDGAEPLNQLWTPAVISQPEDEDAGAVYSFSNTGLGVRLFTSGAPGDGLTARNFSSPLQVTPIDDLDGLFIIAPPSASFAVTTSDNAGDQLKLQPLNTLNPRQQWSFVAFGNVPPEDDD